MKKFFSLLFLLLLLVACARAPAPLPALTPEPKIEPSAAVTLTAEPPTPEPTATTVPTSAEGLFLQTGRMTNAGARQVVWMNDGLSLALVSENGVAILDVKTLGLTHTFSDPTLGILLDFSADGRTLAATHDQSSIDLIDIYTLESRKLETGILFNAVSFSPEGSLFVVTSNEEWAAHIWDAKSGQFRLKMTGFETAAPVYQVNFAASMLDLLWIARGTVQVQNIPSTELYPAVGHEDFVSAVALANGEPLLVTTAGGTLDGEFTPLLYVWDVLTGEELLRIRQDQPAYSLHFSPNDRFLAVGEGENVVIFTTADMNEVDRLPGHSASVVEVRFSPDGSRLAALDSDGLLILWQLAGE